MADQSSSNEMKSISNRGVVWRRFKRHRLAHIGLVLLAILYTIALFPDFFAPNDPTQRFPELFSPPQTVHVVDEDGRLRHPFICARKKTLDMETFRYTYEDDMTRKYPIRILVHGYEYRILGLFKSDLHLLGTGEDEPFLLMGTERLGRCLFSRIIHGTRISLTLGLLGVSISLILGLILGGISGLCGGFIDNLVQRVIEVIMSIPVIPLWMALSAAIPKEWTATQVFFAIVIILSLIQWTGLARVVRGKFLALREEEFITAARAYGVGPLRLVVRHMIPNFISYALVHTTLAIPAMILGETSLSFLGLGLRPPVISWGVLLSSTLSFQTVALYPWLLMPGLFVVIAVLAFNFVGDGLRDALDPLSYKGR